MDWVEQISSEPTEEREEDMSSLTARFVVWMHKRVVSAQRETASGSEGLATSTQNGLVQMRRLRRVLQ